MTSNSFIMSRFTMSRKQDLIYRDFMRKVSYCQASFPGQPSWIPRVFPTWSLPVGEDDQTVRSVGANNWNGGRGATHFSTSVIAGSRLSAARWRRSVHEPAWTATPMHGKPPAAHQRAN